ncbi:MAG: hypothetical protein QOG23_858 [Blastocatellia bacterium]|jgi:tetratricopeptide (TPR) repeat protein|nr:hypothetical protein [Blastocatellia bacterium]
MANVQLYRVVMIFLILGFALTDARLAGGHGISAPAPGTIRNQSPQQPAAAPWFDEVVNKARTDLDSAQRNSGGDSDKTVAALKYLAGLLFERGDYAEAETLYLRVLKIQAEKFGLTQNPELMATENHLAEITRAQGERAKAEQMYQETLQIFEKVSPDSPEVAVSLNGLAEIYRLKHDYARAEPFYSRALEIRLKLKQNEQTMTYGDDAEILNNMGQLYRDKGDVTKAEQFFQRAIASYDATYPVLHVGRMVGLGAYRERRTEYTQVAGALQNLGDLYRVKGGYAVAEPLYRRALEFREQAFGSKHRLVGETLRHLALLLTAKGDKAAAAELQARADAIGRPPVEFDPTLRTDRTLAGLAGTVQTVLWERGSDSGPIREQMITFDVHGRKTELLMYSATGELQQKTIYKYEDGKLKEELRYDSKDVLTGKTIHSLDASGRRTTTVDYDRAGAILGTTTYNYDAKGNLSEEKTKSSFAFGDRNVVYSYNTEGELISKTGNGGTGLRKTTRYRYEYGKLAEESADNLPERVTIKYDSRGNVEEKSSQFVYTYTKETYKYNYDDQGNWTRQAVVREVTTMPGPGASVLQSAKKEQFTEFHQRNIAYFK